jgi:hypothetical protein
MLDLRKENNLHTWNVCALKFDTFTYFTNAKYKFPRVACRSQSENLCLLFYKSRLIRSQNTFLRMIEVNCLLT